MRFFKILLIVVFGFAFVSCSALAEESKPECQVDKEQLRELFKKHPEIIMEVLSEHSDQLYDLYIKAGNERKRANWSAGIKNQLKNPLKPVLDPARPYWGSNKAKKTIVLFSNFKCHSCILGVERVSVLLSARPEELKLLIKHICNDELSSTAAIYYEAVGRQSPELAQEFHHRVSALLKNNKNASGEDILKVIESLDLDLSRLDEDFHDPAISALIEADKKEFKDFRLRSTPTFIVEGAAVKGAAPPIVFEEILAMAEELKKSENK